jgi:hypothetical protein
MKKILLPLASSLLFLSLGQLLLLFQKREF